MVATGAVVSYVRTGNVVTHPPAVKNNSVLSIATVPPLTVSHFMSARVKAQLGAAAYSLRKFKVTASQIVSSGIF